MVSVGCRRLFPGPHRPFRLRIPPSADPAARPAFPETPGGVGIRPRCTVADSDEDRDPALRRNPFFHAIIRLRNAAAPSNAPAASTCWSPSRGRAIPHHHRHRASGRLRARRAHDPNDGAARSAHRQRQGGGGCGPGRVPIPIRYRDGHLPGRAAAPRRTVVGRRRQGHRTRGRPRLNPPRGLRPLLDLPRPRPHARPAPSGSTSTSRRSASRAVPRPKDKTFGGRRGTGAGSRAGSPRSSSKRTTSRRSCPAEIEGSKMDGHARATDASAHPRT